MALPNRLVKLPSVPLFRYRAVFVPIQQQPFGAAAEAAAGTAMASGGGGGGGSGVAGVAPALPASGPPTVTG